VALSGGVDSAVAALLLKQSGVGVEGAYMRTWQHEEGLVGDCPWKEDLEAARAVAATLDINLRVINMIDVYRERVVQYLVDGYKRGVTPNPDMLCNREVKFGALADYALKEGFGGLATGHYCRKWQNDDGSFDLLEGVDDNKDQSYFLALISQEQLAFAHFPIGDMKKPAVRAFARTHGLPNADRKDSQGICFLGEVPINDFLQHYIPDTPGNIVNLEGRILGQHRGLHRYTIGQRKGIGVPSNTDFENYVVLSKNFDTHELVVGFDRPETPGLYTTEVFLENVSFLNRTVDVPTTLLARPRYRDPMQPITLTPLPDRCAHIAFQSPQRALAKGQVLAIYRDNILLGGGVYGPDLKL